MNFAKNIVLEIKNIKLEDKQIKKFGILLFVVFAILAYIYRNDMYIAGLLTLGAIFSILGVIRPHLLHALYRTWMGIAIILGFFVSKIVLGLLFYILLTPIGFITRVIKGDILNQKIDRDKKSYWTLHEDKKDKESLEHPF